MGDDILASKNEYILFLDETDASANNKFFCLAGFIISRKEYEEVLIPKINQIKIDVLNRPHIVFHYTDMKKQKDEFSFLNDSKIRENFWLDMCKSLNSVNFTTLAAYIDVIEYRKNYSRAIARSEYDVLFYEIINSFVHFLIANNGVGTIMLESRELGQNKNTQTLFSLITQTGTNIYLPYTIQKYISTMNFNIKKDNCIGLQVADMIPSVFVRNLNGKPNKYSLYSIFESKLYKGGKPTSKGYGFIEILR